MSKRKSVNLIFFSLSFLWLTGGGVVATSFGQSVESASSSDVRIQFTESPTGISVMAGGEVFTELHKSGFDKPILYPVFGPNQIPMTRSWPMRNDVEGEPRDHPHHKSIWLGHIVNGIDFWTERDGLVELKSVEIDEKNSSIETKSEWVRRSDRSVICSDRIVYQFGATEKARWLDATITLIASHQDLILNDTKEGFFAIRTHPHLQLTPTRVKKAAGVAGVAGNGEGVVDRPGGLSHEGADIAGTAINSEGVEGKAVWGKSAKWVLYSGRINGQEAAIAFMDHPDNLRHPAPWHARDYGLVAVNPFGLHELQQKPAKAGETPIKKGEQVTLRYRLVFIQGIPDVREVENGYELFCR